MMKALALGIIMTQVINANNTIEIELRYEVLKPEQLSSFVAPLEKQHTKHDIDIYFDNPIDYLHKNGIYIRMRNNKTEEDRI